MERRRSERLSESLPLIVRGIDLLGQPFEERTNTLNFNLHGCRYPSKHHLPKNSWITLELPQASQRPNVRARVAWVQRPHSIRDFFQIAAELESPANIWGFETTPADWPVAAPITSESAQETPQGTELRATEESESPAASVSAELSAFMGQLMNDMAETPSFHPISEPTGPIESSVPGENPLLQELRGQVDQYTKEAVVAATEQAREQLLQCAQNTQQKNAATIDEFLDRWRTEFEEAQTDAREEFSSQLAVRQDSFLKGLKSEFEENFVQARELMAQLTERVEMLRSESKAAQDAEARLAQARLQFEAAEASRSTEPSAQPPKEETAAADIAAATWHQYLSAEMTVALAQWKELLQSSLDSGMQRLVEQISERSQDMLRETESKASSRMAEMRQPLEHAALEGREALAAIKSSLDQELSRARASLSEIDQVAGRTKEYSAQLEAASHDTLNELHRRLEKILDAQTAEMNRRAENLAAGVSQRLAPALDSLGQECLDRALAQVESKLAPHFDRVPELLRELSAREVQVEESLRLHRERLRQVSENNQREVSAQMNATTLDLRNDFESARKEALEKWGEELDASGVRASQSASESLGRASEWFQQEARARLQVLVEQTLTTAGASLGEKTAEAGAKFATQLAGESDIHRAQIHQQLESVASEVSGRTRTEMEKASETAANLFGQVLHKISDLETQEFATTSRQVLLDRTQELERSTEQHVHQIEERASNLVESFHAQMASQLESSLSEGRTALSAEFASALDNYRAEREEHHQKWAENLDHLSGEAVGRYKERLDTTCDSWMVSSVRRLNEHGQNVIESLLRSSDQALRESCSKVFEGLAEMLRERTTNAAGVSGVAGFTPGITRESSDTLSPRNEAM